jgi:hypothetical protein
MEGHQGLMPPAAKNEREMTALAKAIEEAITPDIDALSRIIAAKLQGLETSNEPAVKVSTIEEKIEQSVSAAVKAAMADVVRRPVMDVTALRDQTLGSLPHSPTFCTRLLTEHTANIEFLYALMTDPSVPNPPNMMMRYSAPKLITAVISVPGGQHFSASVLRLELKTDVGTIPRVTIEVCRCKSNIEALQKLYEFSQDVVSNARSLRMNVHHDFWKDLECIHWGEDRSMGIGWV